MVRMEIQQRNFLGLPAAAAWVLNKYNYSLFEVNICRHQPRALLAVHAP